MFDLSLLELDLCIHALEFKFLQEFQLHGESVVLQAYQDVLRKLRAYRIRRSRMVEEPESAEGWPEI